MSTCRVLVLPRQVRTHFCVRMTEGSSRKARNFFYFGRNSRAESERVQSARRFGGLAKPSKEESCQGVWGGRSQPPPSYNLRSIDKEVWRAQPSIIKPAEQEVLLCYKVYLPRSQKIKPIYRIKYIY